MPSNHVNRVLRDSEAVSKRMLESKKEIESLKAEYERLLESGLQARTSNITDTDKQKEILNKREERDMQSTARTVSTAQNSRASSSNVNIVDNQTVSVKRKAIERLGVDSARTVLEQGSPPKVRHYNVEDARDYIKKQRERRLQQQKQLKETDNVIELKKQKLKDLHQKSLQIVARNRQRSKSREKHPCDVPLPAPVPVPTSTRCIKVPEPNQIETIDKPNEIKPLTKILTKPLKPHLNIASTTNITYRVNNYNLKSLNTKSKPDKIVKPNKIDKYNKSASTAKSDDAKIKAATLIQAYFRGHIQRKLYHAVLKQQTRNKTQTTISKVNNAAKQDKQQLNQDIKSTLTEPEVLTSDLPKITEDKSKALEIEKKIPEWLQIEPTYHPFNFINSVKRKLNVALNTPVKTSDVGIQSSLSEAFTNKSFIKESTNVREEQTPNRYKDLKDKIELSLSSKKSDKEINAKIERSLEAIRSIQREHAEQLINGFDKGGNITNKSNKPSRIRVDSKKTSINGDEKGFLDLDVKKIKQLRLQSNSDNEHSDHTNHSDRTDCVDHTDQSDCDTSRNIPDISLESHYKPVKSQSKSISEVGNFNLSSKSKSATELSVFKQPKEPPPKPKRLSRHELYSNEQIKQKTKHQSVDDHKPHENNNGLEEFDDFKLNINVEKLKNIRLQSRVHNVESLDNTMSQYEHTKKSSSSINSGSQHNLNENDNSGSSSSINTISRYQSQSVSESQSSQNSKQSQKLSVKSQNSQKVSDKTNESQSYDDSHAHSQLTSAIVSFKNSSRGSRRDSTITGNITRYTKSFDTYHTDKSKNASGSHKSSIQTKIEGVSGVKADETADIPENLLSFRQYMKDMDETQKIMHTPFQPKGFTRKVNADKRLEEVISKVNALEPIVPNKLDKSQSLQLTQDCGESKAQFVDVNDGDEKVKVMEDKICDSVVKNCDDLGVTSVTDVNNVSNVEEVNEIVKTVPLRDELVPPNVNLIVVKCNDRNGNTEDARNKNKNFSAKTSTETIANANGSAPNQIHVKFEAELHLLNDFNESLKQIMNIEKSMLDLQTKYNLQPTERETKDTQTSVINNTNSITQSTNPTNLTNNTKQTNSSDTIVTNSANNKSHIEKSINFSRGSDFEWDNNEDKRKVIVLHENKNAMDSSSNSTLNISDITLNMNNSMNTINTTSVMNVTDIIRDDLSTPKDKSLVNKLSSAVSVGMLDQLIRDEDARIENLKTVLKIREKTLLDRTKGELTWLEIQKKHLLETGKLHEASLLKKKQRGIILRLQEEKNEMQKLREAQKAASKERKTKLKEQCALIKAQLSQPTVVTRIKRSAERRSSGPVKVYQSEYYQSETSVSRKSTASASESIVYASRSASIISHVADDGATSASRTELAKRSLQMREAALQKRRKEAEDLLKWHQKLLREERKIAELEMAASNVINQVPSAASTQIWNDITAKHNQRDGTKAKDVQSTPNLDVITSICSQSSKYSTDFDSDHNGDQSVASGTENTGNCKQADGRLGEIMQNINNITDEISELYLLSSMQKSGKSDSSLIETDDSVSKSRSSKASIINKAVSVKSVPEVSVRVKENSEKVPSVMLTDVKSKTSKSLDSSINKNSFIRIQSTDLSLHDVQLPEREETEDDFSSIKSEVQLGAATSETSAIDVNASDESCHESDCQTLKPQLKESSSKSDNEVSTHSHQDSYESGIKLSEESHSVVADPEPNDLQETHKQIEETSNQSGSVLLNEAEEIIDDSNEIPSSKDVSEVSQEEIEVKTDETNDQSALIVNTDNELLNQYISILPSSKLETLIDDLIEKAEEQTKTNEVSELQELSHDETDKQISGESVFTFAASQASYKSPQSAIEENLQDQSANNLVSEQIDETQQSISPQSDGNVNISIASDILLKDIVADVVEDVNVDKSEVEGVDDEVSEHVTNDSVVESVVVDNENESETENSKSEVESEVYPIIGVKIEEKQHDVDVGLGLVGLEDQIPSENDIIDDNVSLTPRSLQDIETSITDDIEDVEENVPEEFVDDKTTESVDDTSVRSVDVKKRVSEILADAHLNTSIEEKSPRLPDIYVTTYDVISPDNSPELGSPVSSDSSSKDSKAKPKDIYGIGNEAQELLKKQLAIEQEIKQIERQQKEQLPYIFVREIPNKPPPPYTPPVQQPTSIVPTTATQIEEITPYLAEIFHRSFVDKTLEYVTFPDTQLQQLDSDKIDKVCAEFLFDIAKEYAVSHYKQFAEPDDKAPVWMRLNKPKSFKRPFTQSNLEGMLKKKLKQLFAFEKSDCKESMIIKWSRKKRDHVDELLVVESQSEEAEWTNYDEDELIVREEVTTGLLDMLIEETAMCLQEIFSKREANLRN